jgi:hypothetical protein
MIDYITSDALTARHGFFTRKGGASSGIFAGLNCGTGSSDQTEAVTINRTRVAEAMGLDLSALMGVNQVHSADVVTLTGPLTDRPRADALVTDRPGLLLSVLTADCQPVLFQDAEAGVIGAAHAGWRGARDGVLEATLAAMAALGARAERTHVVIGPTISQPNYEVGPEFFETFTDDDPETRRFFINSPTGRYLFDLPGYGLWRLRRAGVGLAEWTGHCTYRDAESFYSFRRTTHAGEADYGRQISVIRL